MEKTSLDSREISRAFSCNGNRRLLDTIVSAIGNEVATKSSTVQEMINKLPASSDGPGYLNTLLEKKLIGFNTTAEEVAVCLCGGFVRWPDGSESTLESTGIKAAA